MSDRDEILAKTGAGSAIFREFTVAEIRNWNELCPVNARRRNSPTVNHYFEYEARDYPREKLREKLREEQGYELREKQREKQRAGHGDDSRVQKYRGWEAEFSRCYEISS